MDAADKHSKEVRLLKQKIDELSRENAALKRSLYDVSSKYNSLAPRALPFSLDTLLGSEASVQHSIQQQHNLTTSLQQAQSKSQVNLLSNSPSQIQSVKHIPITSTSQESSLTSAIVASKGVGDTYCTNIPQANTQILSTVPEGIQALNQSIQTPLTLDKDFSKSNQNILSSSVSTTNTTDSHNSASSLQTQQYRIIQPVNVRYRTHSNTKSASNTSNSYVVSTTGMPMNSLPSSAGINSVNSSAGLTKSLENQNNINGAFVFEDSTRSNSIVYESPTLNYPPQRQSKWSRQFMLKYDIQGHQGPVYSVQFSPCGLFLATGSFDNTVKIWDPLMPQAELHSLRKHSSNISDLSWSADSTRLLSGSYDRTCRLWDVATGKQMASFLHEGFIQCTMYNPKDANVFLCGTSRNFIVIQDQRSPNDFQQIRNESMINSLYALRDGITTVSVDADGYIKVWDIRNKKCLFSKLNEQNKNPLSHITAYYESPDDINPARFAVNAYDNTIRVYDNYLGSQQFKSYASSLKSENCICSEENNCKLALNKSQVVDSRVKMTIDECNCGCTSNNHNNISNDSLDSSSSLSSLNPLQNKFILRGFKNRNWPIKSSFLRIPGDGGNNSTTNVSGNTLSNSNVTNETHNISNSNSHIDRMDSISSDGGENTTNLNSQDNSVDISSINRSNVNNSKAGTTLVATGSADSYVYIYNVMQSGYENNENKSNTISSLVDIQSDNVTTLDYHQKLEGHTGRVYAANFHPHKPLLASCSADFTVKLWSLRDARRR